MAMSPEPQVPTGPFMSFQEIPHPLPETVQDLLKSMSIAAHYSGEDNGIAFQSLDLFIGNIRDVFGVEHLRREFR